MCGVPDSDKLVLEFALFKKTFDKKGIRYILNDPLLGTSIEKDRFDACYYIVETPSGLLKSGKIFLRFLKIDNIEVYLTGTNK